MLIQGGHRAVETVSPHVHTYTCTRTLIIPVHTCLSSHRGAASYGCGRALFIEGPQKEVCLCGHGWDTATSDIRPTIAMTSATVTTHGPAGIAHCGLWGRFISA
jgi:hypothetical protein